jgi:hypothetical protein
VGKCKNAFVPEVEEDPRWKLVFEEAQRALTYQQGVLDSLRTRATVLTAAAALVSTLFGVPALKSNELGLAAGFAIGSAALVLISAAIICAPWYSWSFASNASILAENVSKFNINEFRCNLAANFDDWYNDNAERLKGLQWTFTAGLFFLLIETLAWWNQVLQV